MSPRRQPSSLFDMCTKKAFSLVATTCYHISDTNQNTKAKNQEADIVKEYLMKMLPARFFEILCLKRQTLEIHTDPHLWLRILTHPSMAVFKSCDLDTTVSNHEWDLTLRQMRCLRILDIQFICDDKLLKVIANNCLQLEELNIISFSERKEGNSSGTEKKISDVGLKYLTKLKQLRKLTLDPPTSQTFSKIEISTEGIRMLLAHLPLLENLQTQRHVCIASILYATGIDLGPLRLRALRSINANCEALKEVIRICPDLQQLSVTYNRFINYINIFNEIINSNVRLNRLILTNFSYTPSMERLLEVQSPFLTELTLENLPHELDLDELETIGITCPNLIFFSLHILDAPYLRPLFNNSRRQLPHQNTGLNFFQKLECLKLAGDHCNIQLITIFLLSCTQNIKSLFVKYDKPVRCTFFNHAIKNGYLKNIERLVLDNLRVSRGIIKTLIKEHEALSYLKLSCNGTTISNFIRQNNYDLYFKNDNGKDKVEMMKLRSRLYFARSLENKRLLPQRFKHYTEGYNKDDFVDETLSNLLMKCNRLSQSTARLTRRLYDLYSQSKI